MSSANANSSKKSTKELELVMMRSARGPFSELGNFIPENDAKFFYELGEKEIKVYNNELKKGKDGKTKRINSKTGKAYVTRTVSKRIDASARANMDR